MPQTSIVQQWAISIVLSTLPLVLAVAFALWTISSQTQTHKKLLADTLELQTATSQFREELSNAERSIRQFLLLKDERFREIYLQKFNTLETVTEQLFANPLMSNWLVVNIEKKNRFATILTHLTFERISEKESKVVADDFQVMTSFALEIQNEVQLLIANSLKQKEQTFNEAIKTLSLLGLFVLPITVLLFLLSSRRITVPFSHLTRAMRRIGRGQLKHPILIKGPSDVMALSETLELMRLQLIDTEQQKQEFISHITHELKTPLASVIEASSLLLDEIPGHINQKQQNVLQILSNNADSLKVRIEQLLTYNTVTQSKIDCNKVIELHQFVSNIASNKTLLSSESKVIWKISKQPLEILSDPVRLEMILSNLFSNAIYYSNTPATIQVHWYLKDEYWQCIVSDNGSGIAKENLSRIYEPFYQGSNKRKGTLKGSGIGLAIVKKCVASLNGTIQVMSEIDIGTEFTLRFPRIENNL